MVPQSYIRTTGEIADLIVIDRAPYPQPRNRFRTQKQSNVEMVAVIFIITSDAVEIGPNRIAGTVFGHVIEAPFAGRYLANNGYPNSLRRERPAIVGKFHD